MWGCPRGYRLCAIIIRAGSSSKFSRVSDQEFAAHLASLKKNRRIDPTNPCASDDAAARGRAYRILAASGKFDYIARNALRRPNSSHSTRSILPPTCAPNGMAVLRGEGPGVTGARIESSVPRLPRDWHAFCYLFFPCVNMPERQPRTGPHLARVSQIGRWDAKKRFPRPDRDRMRHAAVSPRNSALRIKARPAFAEQKRAQFGENAENHQKLAVFLG